MRFMLLPSFRSGVVIGGVITILLFALPGWGEETQPSSRPPFPILDAPPVSNQADVLRNQGKLVYERYCIGCHGGQGDGNGPAARLLIVKPRDFTKGIFKFRSTPSGMLPTDEDLYRAISRGVYGTSMPEWSLLPERDRLAVIQYIKTFYPEWEQRGAGKPIYIPEPPDTFASPAAVARGKELYELLECTACHGASGRGDGPSAATLDPDAWGNKQRPFNFTKGRLHGGPTVKDIYRTFMTGIGGTAMPSYADIFGQPDEENIREGDAWNLVSYIVSLRQASQPESTITANQPSKGSIP
jgi:cytochrome c oxidase cbb3-type subunit 2